MGPFNDGFLFGKVRNRPKVSFFMTCAFLSLLVVASSANEHEIPQLSGHSSRHSSDASSSSDSSKEPPGVPDVTIAEFLATMRGLIGGRLQGPSMDLSIHQSLLAETVAVAVAKELKKDKKNPHVKVRTPLRDRIKEAVYFDTILEITHFADGSKSVTSLTVDDKATWSEVFQELGIEGVPAVYGHPLSLDHAPTPLTMAQAKSPLMLLNTTLFTLATTKGKDGVIILRHLSYPNHAAKSVPGATPLRVMLPSAVVGYSDSTTLEKLFKHIGGCPGDIVVRGAKSRSQFNIYNEDSRLSVVVDKEGTSFLDAICY